MDLDERSMQHDWFIGGGAPRPHHGVQCCSFVLARSVRGRPRNRSMAGHCEGATRDEPRRSVHEATDGRIYTQDVNLFSVDRFFGRRLRRERIDTADIQRMGDFA